MNYEEIKNEYLKVKMEQLDFLDSVVRESSKRKLSEVEKMNIYRKNDSIQKKLVEVMRRLKISIFETYSDEEINYFRITKAPIFSVEINNDYLSSANISEWRKEYLLTILDIDCETYKHDMTIRHLRPIEIEVKDFLVNQKLFAENVYVDSELNLNDAAKGYFSYAKSAYYTNILSEYISDDDVYEHEIPEFEQDKIIIRHLPYVSFYEISSIFKEEVLNINNNSIDDCVIRTRERINELNYKRSPEYKEKVLLERINELYKSIKGEYIKSEVLYDGKFIDIIKEFYELPTKEIVTKEKVVKNHGKNAVIIIPITQEGEYIVSFQNRIKDTMLAEFPSGYIEDENIYDAARRELLEETGYYSNKIELVDEVYTSPGIDNSKAYIMLAQNCVKKEDVQASSSEYLSYGLFSERELTYFVKNNIMLGSLNKLAYYSLTSKYEEHKSEISNSKGKVKIYKALKKENPIDL